MKLMQWDSNLARQAQNWANTCPDETTSNLHLTSSENVIKLDDNIGENMIKFYDYNYSIPYEHAIDQWANSKKYSDGNKLINPWNDFQVTSSKLEVLEERSWKMTLFYENYLNSNWYQMIWADADKVSL